ncbi:MAG: 1-acyl-sn-glycerol-3-phosphate acyltransferase [Alphaproteobacteria bacterium]|nr:1-acyl-sn-glycerol-3-phosphate acyltransferase [Alphaproteobacteria bacterium]
MLALRSALFMVWFLCLTLILAILCLPLLAGPRGGAVWLGRVWSKATLWGLKVFAGTHMRVTGTPPAGPVLVAAKHMSMWDTLALHLALGDPGIVLKRELLNIPFYGWYLGKAAAIPIERAAGARALRLMTDAARKVLDQGRPVLIFPEGTRKKPGAPPDYKPGVAGLYAMLDVACVPVALDSGVYWRGFWKRPGTITLAFLEPIPPGLKRAAFMPLLEQRIEQATQALVARAS